MSATGRASMEAAAQFLFGLLDDIDTASDIAKDNDQLYRSLVHRLHRRRFEVASTDGYSVTFKAVADVDGQCQVRRPSSAEPVPSSPSQAAVLVVDRLRRICDLDPFGDKLCALDQEAILKAADILEGAPCWLEKALQQMKAMREVIATAPPGTWGYNADGDLEEPHLTRTWANQDEHLHYADLGIAELETALSRYRATPKE